MSFGNRIPRNLADPAKAEAAILAVGHCMKGCSGFGKTVLEKVLFYSDQRAYLETGKTITGLIYVRQKYGPTADPSQILPLVEGMEKSGKIKWENNPVGGKTQKRLIPLVDTGAKLSSKETQILQDTAAKYANDSATDVSKKSHRGMAWQIARDMEEIPAFTALLSEAPVRQSDVAWAKQLIEHR